MDKEFAQKVLLITGATSGIGKATALRFAEAGASIAAVGRNEAALADLKEQIEGKDAGFLAIRADLLLEEEAGNAVSKTVQHFGGVDVLVNAAGHIFSGTIENTPLESWDVMLNINLRAGFIL